MELDMKWFDQINEEIKSNASSKADEKKQWEKHSIYKVPSQVTELNKKAYKPQTISFGPYHHGEDSLEPMEEHKHRALLHFLKSCGNPIKLIFQKLYQVAPELKDLYKSLDSIWINDTSKFIQMMIIDGCFILEFLNLNCPFDYDHNDPVFSEYGKFYMMQYITRDMLMLENQIPMAVLHTLIQVQYNTEADLHELLNKTIINLLLCPITSEDRNLGKCMHVLDLYRKYVIQEPSHPPIPKSTKRSLSRSELGEDYNVNRSAMELKEAGISFKKSKTRSLRDVSFNQGVLRLPTLIVEDNTEYIFLNLMAFERLHVGAGSKVTSFVCFMDTIIDSAKDVEILIRSDILINYLESDEAVAKLFNSLAKEAPMDCKGELGDVANSIISYCRKPWKRWRASLIHTYFKNPWAIVSLVAAFFLFALTIIQTIYTVGQFYQKEG